MTAAHPNDPQREMILSKIRASLGRRRDLAGQAGASAALSPDNLSPDDISPDNLRQRLEAHRPAPVLSRLSAAHDPQALVALFLRMTAAINVKITPIANLAEIPNHLAALSATIQPKVNAAISLAVAGALRDLPWHQIPPLTPHFGAIRGGATIAVQQAFAGIAETGSVMVCSSPDHPTSLNFLGDYAVVILSAADIVPSLEAAWHKWRGQKWRQQKRGGQKGQQRGGEPSPTHNHARDPRLINIITGPSRTADIEGKILLGAHGPVELHIFLVSPHVQTPLP
ncbi:MAG: LUD domain-containing protein [Candidatus Symbiobacter sp.]|nr:LUD domain-containing protein [Candidatus Symbiobacter sp.]